MADGLGFGAHPGLVQALREAAEKAGHAPSILNTQPWRFRVQDGVLELYADLSRQVTSIDPQARLLTLSCGAALHHVRLAFMAAGFEPVVTRFPDPGSPALLARIQIAGPHTVRPGDIANMRSMRQRHSDRRPLAATTPVPAEAMAALHAAAEAEHARLHRIGSDQLVFLRAAAERAQTVEADDERYLAELDAWTRDRARGEGVPVEVIVATVPRPVPMRDFAVGGQTLLDPGFGDDRFAEYLVLATDGDEPTDWLRVGEATSAVWLTATARGLAVSAISEVVEVSDARIQLESLFHRSGHAQLLLRVGYDVQPVPPPASPRRRPEDIITTEPPD